MIRKAVNEDYKKIYELGSLLHKNYKETYDLAALEKKEYYKTYVYEENNSILGFIMFLQIIDTIEIIDLVVDINHRRKKIATQLINRMITNSKKNDKIYLEVSEKNNSAIDLYEKFGFKKIGIRKKYYGNDDAHVMERVNEDE